MSRLEAGRRYRRVYCLTLGICYDDAVLMLCWGCGRPGADWRRRVGTGEETAGGGGRRGYCFYMGITFTVSAWKHCRFGGRLPDRLVGAGVGEWGCSGGGRMRDFKLADGDMFCFVSMSTMDSRGWVSCFSTLLGPGSPWLGPNGHGR